MLPSSRTHFTLQGDPSPPWPNRVWIGSNDDVLWLYAAYYLFYWGYYWYVLGQDSSTAFTNAYNDAYSYKGNYGTFDYYEPTDPVYYMRYYLLILCINTVPAEIAANIYVDGNYVGTGYAIIVVNPGEHSMGGRMGVGPGLWNVGLLIRVQRLLR